MTGPLEGIRVVEISPRLGAYAGRLLATLGASVTAVIESERDLPALLRADETPVDGTDEFHRSGREWLVAGARGDARWQEVVAPLMGSADLLLTGLTAAELLECDLPGAGAASSLVHLSVTPYGLTGPKAEVPGTDLTVLAAGGLLSLAGEPAKAPTRPYGHQGAVAASLHGVFGALAALRVAAAGAGGQVVDVSAQDAVVHTLENASQYWDLEGFIRRRVGGENTEAGNGVFECADGEIYVMTMMHGGFLAWENFVAWVRTLDESAGEEFARDRWEDVTWRRTPEAKDEFRRVIEAAVRPYDKRFLYESGQERGVNIVEVADALDLLRREQLTSRDFFVSLDSPRGKVIFPGPPFRFSRHELTVGLGASVPAVGGSRA